MRKVSLRVPFQTAKAAELTMSDNKPGKEEQILIAVKETLTAIAKDTYTPPELSHPLSKETINRMRECFGLVVNRQQELAAERGVEFNQRPRYTDEPSDTFIVSLDEFRNTTSTKKED
jgi:hypothetical protein